MFNKHSLGRKQTGCLFKGNVTARQEVTGLREQSLEAVLWVVIHSPFLPLKLLQDQNPQQKVIPVVTLVHPHSVLGSYKPAVLAPVCAQLCSSAQCGNYVL